MADKTIKVKVDVETDVEPSIAALKALKKELKATAAGSDEFQRLQQTINDMEDSIKSAKTGASNFTEVLGQLPGPIGDIGNTVSGTVNTLKQFGGLKLTDLKQSFVELGKDLNDAFVGLGKLTGITKLYTILNAGLSKSFMAVGIAEGAAATGAAALSAALIATGIGALVVGLGLAFNALKELVTGEEAAAEAAKQLNNAIESQNQLLELNAKSAQNRNKVELARMKAQGKSAKEIRDTQFKQAKEAYETAYSDEVEASNLYNANLGKAHGEEFKKLQDNLDKRQQATKDAYAAAQELGYNNKAEELKEEETKNKELAGKAKAASDKRLADRKAELVELKKGLSEARLETLSARDKDEAVINEKYDKLKALAIKYGEDTKVIQQAREADLAEVATKYAKEETDKKQKAYDDALALEESQLNLRLAKGEITETEYQNKLFEVRKNAATQTELLTNESLKKQEQNLTTLYSSGKISLEEYNTQKATLEAEALQKNKEFINAQIDLEKYKTEETKKTAEEERGIVLAGLQSKFEALDKENARIDGDFEQDLERITQQKEILAEQERVDLENTELTEFQKTEIRKKYGDARIALSDKEIATEKAAAEAKHAINMAYLGLFEQFGNVLGQIAGKNKGLAIAGVVISQAAAIGQIISQTAIANAKSVAASPLTAGMPWVAINTISAGLSIASTIAGAVKSIQQINSADAGASSGGGGATAPMSAAPPPKPPTVSGTAAPQVETTGGQNPNTQLAETLGKAQAPIKAYVVSGEVSSQQALDRRTSRAATFSGG
jgi:hypothetical protein